jgi:hypothetical protein
MGFLVPLERGSSNPEGETESPIHGELNPPTNQRIPRRNQENATKGSNELSMVCSLERKGMSGEGVCFTRVGLKTQKLDTPISKTGPSSFG